MTTHQQRHPADRASGPPPGYDGGAFPAERSGTPEGPGAFRLRVVVTGAIVVAPPLGLAVLVWLGWGRLIVLSDVLIAAVFYTLTALGVTVGFHRLLTHRSFTAHRTLRIVLAVAGSMAFQGNVIDWVATHRRHHAFTDKPGDPHSPYRYGSHLRGQLRGLAHAHLGWMFRNDPTPAERYAPDLLADPAMVRISRAFPLLCTVSLIVPAGLGWALSGTLHGALTAFVWAGLVRVALLQHLTWSVNSLCHVVGERPYRTRRHDRSTDVWQLAIPSFGESWHNGHHSDPACARHGRGPGQIDLSADLIRLFERVGWATDVRWPDSRRQDRTGSPTDSPAR